MAAVLTAALGEVGTLLEPAPALELSLPLLLLLLLLLLLPLLLSLHCGPPNCMANTVLTG
jgi:hypothetical protein